MSTVLGLSLIALLLALWAVHLGRLALRSAERTAIAAEKSALAAERSAMAAKRGADAAEAAAHAAHGTGSPGSAPQADSAAQARAVRVEALVKELVATWPEHGSAWPLVERNAALNDAEVSEIIDRAFHEMGRTESEARQHATAVLNLRRDEARTV
jgi:hypothetical protein